MNLPPFVYSKAFWTALSYAVAGLLALLAFFGVIPPQYALSATAVLAIFLAVLNWFGITPELRAIATQRKLEYLVEEYEARLQATSPAKANKKLNK